MLNLILFKLIGKKLAFVFLPWELCCNARIKTVLDAAADLQMLTAFARTTREEMNFLQQS